MHPHLPIGLSRQGEVKDLCLFCVFFRSHMLPSFLVPSLFLISSTLMFSCSYYTSLSHFGRCFHFYISILIPSFQEPPRKYCFKLDRVYFYKGRINTQKHPLNNSTKKNDLLFDFVKFRFIMNFQLKTNLK